MTRSIKERIHAFGRATRKSPSVIELSDITIASIIADEEAYCEVIETLEGELRDAKKNAAHVSELPTLREDYMAALDADRDNRKPFISGLRSSIEIKDDYIKKLEVYAAGLEAALCEHGDNKHPVNTSKGEL